MPQIPCPIPRCDRVMPGHLRICTACAAQLARNLGDVPALARELETTATRQARTGTGAGSGETPLQWDERARAAEHDLVVVLTSWGMVLQQGMPPIIGPICATDCRHATCHAAGLAHGPRADTLPSVSRWLLRHLRAIQAAPDAARIASDVARAVHACRRAIDRPPPLLYAGLCDACATPLYARLGAAQVACPRCLDPHGGRIRYDVTTRRDWMLASVEDMRLPAGDIARALTSLVRPIDPALIYTWRARGRLAPHGVDARGRALYRVGDVRDLMDRTAPKEPAVTACPSPHALDR
ncbi:hypothetical protein [Spongiactinospora sp. TRM90649]|uniref:hypothetical protein n=1 Tax=Spongiactinospora sp. TRM90649 TaxID=3031114 RepID=UPI0023F72DC4|nr:hypothetical protein [Spongiactinospora sp. TRM90649]MDF5755808.1 hypothetical protein [Spongiactinospora sp. TRM90649]